VSKQIVCRQGAVASLAALVGLVLTMGLTMGLAAPAIAEVDDPMRPSLQAPETGSTEVATEWTLNSVLISERRRLAVVNGQVLRQGQSVDGARIIRIEPSQVVIRHSAGEETLSLKSELGISRSSGQ